MAAGAVRGIALLVTSAAATGKWKHLPKCRNE
jgi:hypothetical protein